MFLGFSGLGLLNGFNSEETGSMVIQQGFWVPTSVTSMTYFEYTVNHINLSAFQISTGTDSTSHTKVNKCFYKKIKCLSILPGFVSIIVETVIMCNQLNYNMSL